MQDVGVMPLPSPSLRPRLPEAPRAHGRVATNVPVLRRLLKTTEGADGPGGDVALSAVGAPGVLGDIHAQQFPTCWKKNKGKYFTAGAIILIPLLTVNGIFFSRFRS